MSQKRPKVTGSFFGHPVYTAKDAVDSDLGPGVMLFEGQADGAIPNGTRIEKCNREADDSWPDGTQGVVLSSLDMGEDWEALDLVSRYVYMCHFDPLPEQPVMISGKRIKELS